jgi:hypothetical protein
VRATRELGELTPAYRNLLLNTLMAGSSHPEPLVRASSLSNLGEVLHTYLVFLMFCVGRYKFYVSKAFNRK